MWVYTCIYHHIQVWSKENLETSVLGAHLYIGSGGQAQVTNLHWTLRGPLPCQHWYGSFVLWQGVHPVGRLHGRWGSRLRSSRLTGRHFTKQAVSPSDSTYQFSFDRKTFVKIWRLIHFALLFFLLYSTFVWGTVWLLFLRANLRALLFEGGLHELLPLLEVSEKYYLCLWWWV